ncbi:Endonuclease V [Paraconexibacter sp. AEG42_29]|uniref:Endonuclease V n=1 Tax=Paraconexibacter sp. AEG42_29 TaxID=2997339 RepID=A0AAU7AV12_9ACTN
MTDATWSRLAAVDVDYPTAGGASAAIVVAEDARFASIVTEHVVRIDDVEPYRPGHLFARELPCLEAALAVAGEVDLLIVDAYVDLDPEGRPGLGAYAHTTFGIPVIGVAKTAFRTATHAIAVHRGNASRPLYVTAAGLEAEAAAAMVASMVGEFRMPDALRRVDSLARRGTPPD